jgi:RNA polymerase sigma-70 factor (ECF subfamily)
LVSTGRFRTIDRWRRQARLTGALPQLAVLADPGPEPEAAMDEHIADDELRLIFTCYHPALTPDARIALTLREVGGLTTEEIARAYRRPRPSPSVSSAPRPGSATPPSPTRSRPRPTCRPAWRAPCR